MKEELKVDENTIIIGHSSGACAAIRYGGDCIFLFGGQKCQLMVGWGKNMIYFNLKKKHASIRAKRWINRGEREIFLVLNLYFI